MNLTRKNIFLRCNLSSSSKIWDDTRYGLEVGGLFWLPSCIELIYECNHKIYLKYVLKFVFKYIYIYVFLYTYICTNIIYRDIYGIYYLSICLSIYLSNYKIISSQVPLPVCFQKFCQIL